MKSSTACTVTADSIPIDHGGNAVHCNRDRLADMAKEEVAVMMAPNQIQWNCI